MPQFPHLTFVRSIVGEPRRIGRVGPHQRSEANKQNRAGHSQQLTERVTQEKADWIQDIKQRDTEGLASLDPTTIPVFLEVKPGLISSDADLRTLGIEVISEEADGFIIGSSYDELVSLSEKIQGFAYKVHGSGKVADLWSITVGDREAWKPEHVLSAELLEQWGEIDDAATYTVEVGIAFDVPIPAAPDPDKQGGETRLAKHYQALDARDEALMKRQEHFETFISHYGELTSSLVDNNDSFACEVMLTGMGLKDLVHNYPYVFEVAEKDDISLSVTATDVEVAADLTVLPPSETSVEIGVVDSGIMEGHRLLAPAIDGTRSVSYTQDASTADYVQGGGHGTKVAGRVLYPEGVSNMVSPYQLPFFLRNLRVLDKDNKLTARFPAALMEEIVGDHADLSIFNLSISSRAPFRKKHMSTWAATLDKLIHQAEVLFIISTGNTSLHSINGHLHAGRAYPDYLERPACRIANPGQSSFSLVVGSVNHASFEDHTHTSLGREDEPSPFTRYGPGIWGMVKPDVVTYGGGLVDSKFATGRVREHKTLSPELVRSTLQGGSATGRDSVGTSFATPNVTYLAGKVKELYPEEGPNLMRALIVQSARLPGDSFRNPTRLCISKFGYGIPTLDRLTDNAVNRVTFYHSGEISAEEGHLYSITIPEEVRSPEYDFEVLIEVTLAYTAEVRRTRQKTKSYLGTWLDWLPSKMGESAESFSDYALRSINGEENSYESGTRDDLDGFPWKIRRRSDYGAVKEINRNNSSLQKDWAFVRSHELSETFNLSIQGHKGWDRTKAAVPYSIVVSIEVLGEAVAVYNPIRVANQVEVTIET
ncbi:S8 family peptidase [Neolewinella aurantiaca]|uniref:S8 family peptidase n=1 Tax=Neolewinella aurantiaca TaxID=2602767 RepID=A0A5C7FHN9_9BACT|nr:S8 family peptidase [Neolewinella aurantiaca]TXF89321.1 S8 family peptidase [Neolewinella aurantiaca]